jgi:hypothetical protein
VTVDALTGLAGAAVAGAVGRGAAGVGGIAGFGGAGGGGGAAGLVGAGGPETGAVALGEVTVGGEALAIAGEFATGVGDKVEVDFFIGKVVRASPTGPVRGGKVMRAVSFLGADEVCAGEDVGAAGVAGGFGIAGRGGGGMAGLGGGGMGLFSAIAFTIKLSS